MARNETKGTKQVGQAVDADLWVEFVKFCRDRGEKIRPHLEMALRRHLDNPPGPLKPPDPPPLPPVLPRTKTPAEKPAAKKKGKK